MKDEYTDNKIETKAADSSSGSYAPSAEKIPAQEAPDQEWRFPHRWFPDSSRSEAIRRCGGYGSRRCR